MIDTEGSGLFDLKQPSDAAGQPRLAAVAMIRLDANMREIGRSYRYIRPDGWEWDDASKAAAINGIRQAKLAADGIPVADVLDEFVAMIGTGVTFVAHNAQHDMRHMRAELRRAGRPDLFEETRQFCTMRAWAAHHHTKWPKLATLCGYFGINHVKAHDAEGDADAVAKLLPLMRDLGIEIVGEVHRSSKPQFAKRGA